MSDFKFKNYSKVLSRQIISSFENPGPLTIGVIGEWGSGKSRLLYDIKAYFDKEQNDQLIIPVFFNAWRFEKEEHLIIPLLKTSYDEIVKRKEASSEMKSRERLLKIVELITNKKNPPYKKEIEAIDTVITDEIPWSRLGPERMNLRGVSKLSDVSISCNTTNPTLDDEEGLKELNRISLGAVSAITKISEQMIACGGHKITVIDISDLKRPRVISSYLELEPNIYELLNSETLTLVNPNGWDYDNDKILYKYARFYDPGLKRVIPYFNVSEKRVKRSEDKTRLIIKRKKLDQDVTSFTDMTESN